MTTNTLTFVDAISQAIECYNAEAIEHDELVEKTEQLQADNDELNAEVEQCEINAARILEKVKKSDQMLSQAAVERDQALNRVSDLIIQNKDYKTIGSSPKKIRDKIKDYQERLTKQNAAAEQHKRNFLDERRTTEQLKQQIAELTNRLDAASINQIYRNDSDIITMFPYRLGEAVHGFQSEQVPLLYMHHTGRGGLILLNEDGEAQLVDAPKGGLRPKKATMEHCSQILRRFKAKDWQLDASDLESITHNSN